MGSREKGTGSEMSRGDQADEAQLTAALLRCAGGDRTALRVIFEMESARMTGVAFRILRRRDLAEEAVQEAFVRIWRLARSFDPGRGSARTWIYTVLRNRALRLLQDERKYPALDDDGEWLQASAEGVFAMLPEASALRRCLEQLDLKLREAVILAYAHGMSHGELAGKLGVPLGTAKSWTRRGLLSLQECMG
jgi:RNA polymerase sigma-70 factor (ECF subfamily)